MLYHIGRQLIRLVQPRLRGQAEHGEIDINHLPDQHITPCADATLEERVGSFRCEQHRYALLHVASPVSGAAQPLDAFTWVGDLICLLYRISFYYSMITEAYLGLLQRREREGLHPSHPFPLKGYHYL